MSAHVPVPKICDKLKKIDIQICELKYGKASLPMCAHEFSLGPAQNNSHSKMWCRKENK